MVIGASRGLGRGIATAFAEAGVPVVAVARTASALVDLADSAGTVRAEVADARDATVAGSLLGRYEPASVILAAGANPHMRPLQQQTWESAHAELLRRAAVSRPPRARRVPAIALTSNAVASAELERAAGSTELTGAQGAVQTAVPAATSCRGPRFGRRTRQREDDARWNALLLSPRDRMILYGGSFACT